MPNDIGETLYFAARIGNFVRFVMPMFTDQGHGRAGNSMAGGGTTLLRNGEVVGGYDGAGFGLFEVVPERAEYTVRMTTDRSAQARLSMKIDAEWTFATEYTPEDDPDILPLLALRFAPDLDDHNAAPAGSGSRSRPTCSATGPRSPANEHAHRQDVLRLRCDVAAGESEAQQGDGRPPG